MKHHKCFSVFVCLACCLLLAGFASAAEHLIPADGVVGFEYDYPIGTEINQAADPRFDGWAILGSNATKKATLEYNSLRKNRYISVYSELGLREDGVTKGSTVLSRELLIDGLAMVEFDICFWDGVGHVSLKSTAPTNWNPGHTAVFIGMADGRIVAQHGTGTVVLVDRPSQLKWYSFKLVVNTSSKKYSVQVYDGKTQIAEAWDLDFGISSGVQASGIRNINVFLPDQAVNKQVHIDNVRVYLPQVAGISIFPAGNGLRIPNTDTEQLLLTAQAFDAQGTKIPGASFEWHLKSDAPGISIEPISERPDSAWLTANSNAAPGTITITAASGGVSAETDIVLSASDLTIAISGSEQILIPFTAAKTEYFAAVVSSSDGTVVDEPVKWQLYDADNIYPLSHPGVDIDSASGALTIMPGAEPVTASVRATLASDPVIIQAKKVVIHPMRYDLGAGSAAPGYIKVTPDTIYNEATGFGIDPATPTAAAEIDDNRPVLSDYLYAETGYFRFRQKLEPGNYRVKLTFNDPNPNYLTVAVENVPTQRFRSEATYDNRIVKGTIAQSKNAEITFDVALIDGILDIEFIGDLRGTTQYKAFVNSIEITKLEQPAPGGKPTVHLIGDSTVASYAVTDIQAGWGQEIGNYLGSDYIVSNRAIGGRSTASFYREGRLEEVLLSLKPGDLVLIQLGHNDGTYNKEERYTSNADYEMLLEDYYVRGVLQRGGIPVIVTSVPMYGFSSTATLGSYVASARKVAERTGTLLIDAHNLALAHYNSLPGTQAEKEAVLDTYYILTKKGGSDWTHFTKAGAAKMAEIIYNELVRLGLVAQQ